MVKMEDILISDLIAVSVLLVGQPVFVAVYCDY